MAATAAPAAPAPATSSCRRFAEGIADGLAKFLSSLDVDESLFLTMHDAASQVSIVRLRALY
jgi:hypothetical protein